MLKEASKAVKKQSFQRRRNVRFLETRISGPLTRNGITKRSPADSSSEVYRCPGESSNRKLITELISGS